MQVVSAGSVVDGYVILGAWQIELLAPVGTSERHCEVMRLVMGDGLAVLGQHVVSQGVTISLEAVEPTPAG